MKSFVRILFGLATLLALTFAPAFASAQQPDNKALAQERFKAGIKLYEEENFQAALVEFKKAYELVPAYQVLFNIARTCYQLRDYVCALKNYDRYIAEGGQEIEAARKEEVDREIALVNRRVGTLTITTNKGATVTIDGVTIGDAPLPAPVKVNEGRRLVRATMSGHEATEKLLDVAGGDTINIDLPLREPGVGSVTTPPPGGEQKASGTPWWLWGTAGVLAVGAGVCGGLALGASGDADDIRKNGGSVADYDSAQDRMRTLGITADVLGVLALVAGGAALYLTLTDSPKSSAASARRRPLGQFAF